MYGRSRFGKIERCKSVLGVKVNNLSYTYKCDGQSVQGGMDRNQIFNTVDVETIQFISTDSN